MTVVNERYLWSVPRLWDGLECFVVCGGESVRAHDLSRLEGRLVIVVNSSYESLPRANYLVFGDRRWWIRHKDKVQQSFRGIAVTVTPMSHHSDYRLMGRRRGYGLATLTNYLVLSHTTTTAAINLAKHLGVRVINVLGLDGHGRWHHAPHPWRQNDGKFALHAKAVQSMMDPLAECGVQVFTANVPDLAPLYSFIPHKTFEEMTSARAAAA